MANTGPFDPNLLDALESLTIPSWEGEAWRVVVSGTEPLRTNARGARWNPADVEVLYCSLDPAIARREVEHLLSRQPIIVRKPLLEHKLGVRLTRVVDLSGAEQLSRIGFDLSDINQDNPAIPQRIGAAVDWLECAGLLVPSVRGSATNLVILVNRLGSGDRFDVIG